MTNASVTLYATFTESAPAAGNGYGYGEPGSATVLGTATTASDGSFTITRNANACTGQQVYIVANGGNTNSVGTNNPNSLLMAAVGPCASVSSNTFIIINEPSTIAAAYALSQFMYVNPTTGEVDISAPANNNATKGSCVVTSGATTSCVAAGLAHAFLNAANLVDAVGTVGSLPSGNAYATLPTNTSGVVPQLLINSLANSVQACTNSAGGAAPGGVSDGSACGNLFANALPIAQPPSTEAGESACSFTPTVPTLTLQALQDLAQCPSTMTGFSSSTATPSAATAAIWSIAAPNSYYSPSLTASPMDWTLAIVYTGSNGTTMSASTSLGPWGVSPDINDNVYFTDNEATEIVYGFSSNGTQLFTPAATYAAGSCASGNSRCALDTDTLGNVWVINYAAADGLTEVGTGQENGTTGGALEATYALDTGSTGMSVYVDPGNNVWTASSSVPTTGSTLEELPQGTTTLADVDVNGAPVGTKIDDPVLDSYGNMWVASLSSLAVELFKSSNGSLTAPAFAYATGNPETISDPGSDTHIWGPKLDIKGNAWVGDQDQIFEVTGPAGSNGSGYATSFNYVYGSSSGGPGITFAGVLRNDSLDGDGNLWAASTSTGTGYLTVFFPNAPCDATCTADAGTPYFDIGGYNAWLNPCYVASGATTCMVNDSNTGQSEMADDARMVKVDAAGDAWVTVEHAGVFLEVLGIAAPTWPQGSYKPVVYLAHAGGSGRPY